MHFPALTMSLLLSASLVPAALAQAPGQSPQSPDQTQAPAPAAAAPVDIEVVADGLPQLWAMEFLPDGRMLVNAKEGRMLVVGDGSTIEVEGVPEVDSRRQGGLLDVALAPDFETSNRIYFSYAEPREDGNGTTVGSATLTLDGDTARLEDVTAIFRQTPSFSGNNHFGSRLVFGNDGELFITVGERSDAAVRVQAQDLGSGLGKVFRVDAEGQALPDNPFVDTDGALPEIWSLGHRNMQSATLDDQGRLWTVEHGPRGGDELNMPQPGLNYGWPEVTYGVDYSGAPIGEGVTASAETEQPVYYWDPVIAPSGMAFYSGDEFPEWQGAFLVGGLVGQAVVVLHMENDRVVAEERVDIGQRVRDVKVGPDGSVFAVTESRGGASQILQLTRGG